MDVLNDIGDKPSFQFAAEHPEEPRMSLLGICGILWVFNAFYGSIGIYLGSTVT